MYTPSEDSFFFADFLKKYFLNISKNSKPQKNSKTNLQKIKYLDMGTGSGILTKTAAEFLQKKNILAVDIDKESIKLLIKKGFNAVQSNLFENIRSKKRFEIITFNAPYLPQDKREPKDSQQATTGGKKGDEISMRFIKQAKQHLTKKGKIFVLISSLTPINRIKKQGAKIVAEKSLFFEKLYIFEIRRG